MTANAPRIFAVVTAAGSGTRLGYDLPKAFVPIGGKTILHWVCQRIASYGHFDACIVSLPDTNRNQADDVFSQVDGVSIVGVDGGASRQESIYLALEELASRFPDMTNDDTVLIFDAARCAVPHSVIKRVIDGVQACRADTPPEHISVIPALPVVDTVYQVSGDGSQLLQAEGDNAGGRPLSVSHIVDRSTLVNVQTPQGFCAKAIVDAHRRYRERARDEAQAFGDDAQLIMADGGQCFVVLGDVANMKVTYRDDIDRVAAYL